MYRISLEYQKALQTAGVPTKLVLIKGVPNGFIMEIGMNIDTFLFCLSR